MRFEEHADLLRRIAALERHVQIIMERTAGVPHYSWGSPPELIHEPWMIPPTVTCRTPAESTFKSGQ